MNLLKPVFISVFVIWLTLISLYAFTRLFTGMEPLLGWLGLALAACAPLAYLLKVYLLKTPRTPRHPVEYSVVSGLGLAITMAISFRYGEAAGNIHIFAGITYIGWFIYLRWY